MMTLPKDTCLICHGMGEALVGWAATGPVYAVCGCQPEPDPDLPRCYRCRTAYCRNCSGARCCCAEHDTNWNCTCRDHDDD